MSGFLWYIKYRILDLSSLTIDKCYSATETLELLILDSPSIKKKFMYLFVSFGDSYIGVEVEDKGVLSCGS